MNTAPAEIASSVVASGPISATGSPPARLKTSIHAPSFQSTWPPAANHSSAPTFEPTLTIFDGAAARRKSSPAPAE